MFNSEKTKKYVENIFLVFLFLYIFLIFQNNTFLDLKMPNICYPIVTIAMFILSIVKFIVNKTYDKRKYIGIIVLLIYLLYAYFREDMFLATVGIGIFGCIGIDYKKILKWNVIVMGALITITIFMYLSGNIRDNNIYILFRGGKIRSGLGIWYPTGSATMILFYILSLYVAFPGLNILIQVVLALISFIFAYFIAGSRTSSICSLLFIIAIIYNYFRLKYLSDKLWFEKIKNIIKWFVILILPILAITIYFLVFKYGEGKEFTITFNKLLSDRLRLGYEAVSKYKLLPFGQYISLIGGGATRYDGYNYIDSSYLYVLYTEGYLIFAITVLSFVYMIYKAYKINNFRLVIALAIIAINSFMEERINVMCYDIMIALPLAEFTIENSTIKKIDMKKSLYLPNVICFVLSILVFISLPIVFAYINTFSTINYLYENKKIAFIGVLMIFIVIILFFYNLWHLIDKKIRTSTVSKSRILKIGLALIIMVIVSVFIKVNINDSIEIYDKLLKKDNKALDIICKNAKNDVFVYDLPVIYKGKYKNIKYGYFNGYELGRLKPNTVIMPASDDSHVFHGLKYKICHISDTHMIYTSDENVINALEEAGYRVEKNNYLWKNVDIQNLAKLNKLATSSDGKVYLEGKDHTIEKGPYDKFFYRGKFKMHYDLSFTKKSQYYTNNKKNPNSIKKKNALVCTIVISEYNGATERLVQKIYVKDFKNGRYRKNIAYKLINSNNVEYKIIVEDGYKLTLNAMSYVRTN